MKDLKSADELTYEEAITELKEILDSLQNETLSIDHHGSKVTFARLVRTQQCTLHIGMSQPVTHVIDSDVTS